MGAEEPGPFVWGAAAIRPVRVTPLGDRGEPVPCITDRGERPCDIEVTREGQVFDRSRSPAAAGVIGPGLRLRRPDGSYVLFALEPTGILAGPGPFQDPGVAPVLSCRLTEEPALRCHHEVPAPGRETCSAPLVARVDGGVIAVEFPAHGDAAPTPAARIEPAPADDHARALALFLLAMQVVDRDIELHRPSDVVDQQRPPPR